MSYKKLMAAMGIASVMLTGCTQGKDAEQQYPVRLLRL